MILVFVSCESEEKEFSFHFKLYSITNVHLFVIHISLG